MGFPRQEWWSGLPFPSPGDLPDPGIQPLSPALQANSLLTEPPGNPLQLASNNTITLCYWEDSSESKGLCKELKPVNPKGNQPWIFIRRTDAKAEAPILWPPDMKSWLTGKDPDAGKDWGLKEKQVASSLAFKRRRREMMRGFTHLITQWDKDHWLSEQGFEQTPGDGGDRWAWWAAVLWVAKSPTQLSNWTTKSSSFWYTLHISINTFQLDNLLFISMTFAFPFIWTWYISSSMLKPAHTGLWDLLIFHQSSQLHVQRDSIGNLILARVVVFNTMKIGNNYKSKPLSLL